MISLLRGLMSSDGNTNRPLPSLILLGIVDFVCILIGAETIKDRQFISGTLWIVAGIGSALIGYYWQQAKQRIAGDRRYRRAIYFAVAIVLLASVGIRVYRYHRRDQSIVTPATSPPTQSVPQSDEKPPTMLDLFTNRDFPNTMKLADDAIGIKWKDNGRVTPVKRQLYLDFPAKDKFVGFYVPSSDPSDLTRTTEACLKLAQVDAVQQALDELPKKTFIAAGLGHPTTIGDLTFSGRVFIYHDDFMSITQQADIIRAFAAKHYDLQFMGPDHLGQAIIAWHHQHDAKEAH